MPDSMDASEYAAMQQRQRPRKYRNTPVVIDGIRFDSTAEGNRYTDLKRMEEHGAIRDLVLQQRFDLTVNGVKIGEYRADFTYTDNTTGKVVVEDVKGYKNRLYLWKRAHMKAQYGIDILETTA